MPKSLRLIPGLTILSNSVSVPTIRSSITKGMHTSEDPRFQGCLSGRTSPIMIGSPVCAT